MNPILKLSFNSTFHIISLLLMFIFPQSISAFNMQYEGEEILLDQPSGKLQFYTVHTEGLIRSTDYSTRPYTYSWKPYSKDYEVQGAITDDGNIYIKNLFGSNDSGNPTWVLGKIDDKDLVFGNDAIYNFSIILAYFNYIFDATEEDFNNPVTKYLPGIIEEENGVLSVKTYEADFSIRFIGQPDGSYMLNIPDKHGIEASVSGRFVTKCEFRPSSNEYVIPPSNVQEEDYQINFIPFGMKCVYYPEEQRWASLRLKVIRTDNEFYIKGLSCISSGNRDAWVKGEIVGDKVVFKNGQKFGIDAYGAPMYFTPMKIGETEHSGPILTRVDGIKTTMYFNATEQDLIFDYDKKTGRLSNPNSDFGFTYKPNISWEQSWGTEDNSLAYMPTRDYFNQPEIIKIPKGLKHVPMEPKLENRYNDNEKIYYRISYIDKNGYMMEPERIFVVHLDNNTPSLLHYMSMKNWDQESGFYYPFYNQYITNLYELEGIGFNISNWQIFGSYTKDSNVKSHKELVFYFGDNYISCSDSSFEGGFESDIETLVEDLSSLNQKEEIIYDIHGRKMNSKHDLSPGIYIINGKKVKL